MSKAKKIVEKVDMFEMANLWPENTGLPIAIWVEEGRDVFEDHFPRITVMNNPNTVNYEDAVLVTIKDPPRVIGFLNPSIKRKVLEFINLNRDALMDYWNRKISTIQLIKRLRKVGRIVSQGSKV